MKLNLFSLAMLVGLVTNSFAQLTLSLSPGALTGTPGQVLSFNGTLRNTGASEVFLNGISVSLGGLQLTPDESSFFAGFPVSMAPGQEVSGTFLTVTIGSAPEQTATGSVQLTGGATADATDDLTNTTVQVTVVLPPAPEISVEQPLDTDLIAGTSRVDFGPVTVGTGASRTFVIRNPGAANLTGLALAITGANANEFVLTAPPALLVEPLTNTTFTVTFTPAATCVRTASLRITSNDNDENPFDIALTGIGAETNAPSLICPANLILGADPGLNSRGNVIYNVTFSDDCVDPVLTQTAGLPSGATFPVGVTTNRFLVTDSSGNVNTCSFTVTILVPPQMTGVALADGRLAFSFATEAGRSYTLQQNNDLRTTNWITHSVIAGDGQPTQIFFSISSGQQRFFRLQTQ